MTSQKRNLRVVFIATICFVFLLSIFSYTKINSLIESAALVNHTTQVKLGLEKVIGTLKDAETAHWGYLLTHDKTFLQPFAKALKEYPQNIYAVKQVTISNPVQQKSIARIELLAIQRKDFFLKMLEIDKLRTPTAAELLMGKSIMDSLRNEINSMISIQNNLMEERSNQLKKHTIIAPAILFTLSIIVFIILIISYWQLNKSLLQAQQLKAETIKQAVLLDRTKEVTDSEKRFNLMLTTSPFCFAVVKGKNLVIALANTAVKELWAKGNNIEGKPLLEILPELKGTGFPEILQNVIATGKPYYGYDTHTQLNRNGKTTDCYFNFVYQPYYETDESVSGVTIIAIEVTKEVLAKKQLQEADNRFRLMVNQAPVAMCVLKDANFVVELANEKQLQLWGKTKEEVLNIPVFTAVPEAAGQGFEELLSKVFTTGEPIIANEPSVTFSRNGKNEIVYVNFVYEPLYNHQHKIDGVLAVTIDVTEQVIARKKIEESKDAIQESKERLEFILECAKGGYWDLDLLTDKAITSFRHDQCFGATQPFDGWSYEKFLTYVHPEDRENENGKFKAAVATDSDWSVDCRVVWKDGSIHWIQSSGRNYRYIDGKPTRMLGMVREITAQKEAQNKIKENEEKLSIVIEASELGIWEIDLTTNHFSYSNRYLEIMGFPPSKYITVNDSEKLIHPDFIEAKDEAIKKSRETGVFYFAAKIIWEDNSIHWIESKARLFYDEQNHPIKIIGTTEEITQEKQQQQTLLESEQKFRLLADSMPQHIWTSDTDGNLNYYNQSVFNYSGLTLEQINTDGWIQIVHPDDREENIKQWLNAISTGKAFLFEHRFRRYDGEYRWQLSRAIPQRNANGKIQMWVGTSTDIQEQKTREEKKDEFISIASHEMKTPLTTAKAYLQMLELLLAEKNEPAKLYAKKANQAVNRLNELTSELLDVSKIRLGKLNYTITTFNFNDMLESTVENLQLTSTTHTIIKTGKVNNEVNGDADRLQQVVINLLTNAIKYSPGAEKVFVTVEENNDDIIVSVKDTGIGISQQSLDKIFEKYHRVQEHAGRFQGLGIGLFISYEIIQRHNGRLWAESEAGKGSTFYFTIPVNANLP